MTWESPPEIIELLRDELMGSATWVAMGGAEAAIHFPEAVDPAADGVYPIAVLARIGSNLQTFAAGCAPLRAGQLSVTIEIPASIMDVGEMEEYAENIASEMCTVPTIVNLQCVDISQASYPSEEIEAESASTDSDNSPLSSITITFSYGLSA
jgi:hypothetical protein